MKKSFILACLVSGVALSMSACDEGAHNNLDCDDSYVAECLDASHLMKCENAKLVVVECGANQFCTQNPTVDADGNVTKNPAVCSGAPVEEGCTYTENKCSEDGKAVLSCINGKEQSSSCEYGCTDGKCNDKPATCDCETGTNCTDEEKAECDKNKCDCETGTNCTDEEKAECKPKCNCETGENCSDEDKAQCPEKCTSVCGENNALTVTCDKSGTYDVTCAVSCDAEANKCTAMTIEDAGQACGQDYDDKCVGQMLGYCSNGKVSIAFCSGSSSCQISQKLEGYGDCVDTCDEETDVQNECVYDEDEGYYLLTETVCEAIGDKKYRFENAVDACYSGCNEDATGCKLENEWEACDPKTTAPSCSDDKSMVISCYEDGGFMTADICPKGSECMDDGNGNVDCYEPCTKEEADAGENAPFCFVEELWGYEFAAATTRVCKDLGNGQYGYVIDTKNAESCAHECDETTGTCVNYHATEGDKCDNTYVASCDGDVALSCYLDETDGEIEATKCGAYGENFECKVVEGEADCYEKCTEEGATRNLCIDSLFGSMFGIETCTNGYWDGGVAQYMCSSYCTEDGTACEKLVDNEYTECDAKTFTEQCTNDGVLVYCDEGIVAALNCGGYGMFCNVDRTGYGDCYNPCTKEGEVQTSCSSSVESAYKCTAFDDGTLAYVKTDEKNCSNGCNTDYTACK